MKEETKGIRAVVILEIIGKPAGHLTETLSKIIDEMDKEKGISVREKRINEPVLLKEKMGIMDEEKVKKYKDFYTTFAEIEVEVEEVLYLAVLVFKYMPAHIEIVSPELLVLSNSGWNEILNEVTRRLHGYDEVARVMQVERAILEKKMRELMEDKKEGTDKKEKTGKKKKEDSTKKKKGAKKKDK